MQVQLQYELVTAGTNTDRLPVVICVLVLTDAGLFDDWVKKDHALGASRCIAIPKFHKIL